MNLKKEEINLSIERDIVIGLITDNIYIQKVKPIFDFTLLQTSFAKTVSKWCFDYHTEFNEVPHNVIQNIYESNEKILDEDTAETISVFLESISEQHNRKVFNTDYVLRETEKYFKAQSLLRMANDIRADLSQGKVEAAELKRLEYKDIKTTSAGAINIFDSRVVLDILNTQGGNELFKLTGALGELIPPFCRAQLVGLAAPMKFGKTFTCIDWALRAWFQHCNVAYFSLEMNETLMGMRFYQNMTRSLENLNSKVISTEMPYFDEEDDINIKIVQLEGVSYQKIIKKIDAMKIMLKGKGEIRVFCEPSYSLNTDNIKEKLYLEKINSGFIPDVIIIDYEDIKGPERNSPRDFRQAINFSWMNDKKLAQELNCCVIIPTQTSRINFKKDIEADDTSEDIRKLAHVDRFIGLNKGVGPGEENEYAKKHSLRYNVILDRHKAFDPERFVRVLKQFHIGKAYIDSRWVN